jgi:aminoglycoside phosphotransferase (APT) family kinase protein
VSGSPPGLDLSRLARWLPGAVPSAGPRLEARLVPGGKSNLTYEVTDGTGTWILRRPPLGHVLATAHDMGREYRVMSALADTEVPVPRMLALCSDPAVIGAPFYLMSRVEGVPYRTAAQLTAIGPERTRAIAHGMVDTLAALHRVDPARAGLADFGKPEGFLARQVRRWKKQLDASYCRDLPAAGELYRRLAVGVPPESAAGIVHGDYRLDNLLVTAAGGRDRIAAVIDWEMATLGDPLTDLALLLVYHRYGRVASGAAVADAATAPGFPSEDEIIARYGAGSDRDLSRFGFYIALACYKLAVILEGIHYRYLHGQTVGPGFENIGPGIYPLLDMGLAALDGQP